MSIELKKQLILGTISDCAKDFAYYDRKNDEELSTSEIEEAILTGVITLNEIAEAFKEGVMEELGIEEEDEE